MFVRINARVVNGGETKEVWYILRTDHGTMKELHEALLRDKSLCGTRYEVRWNKETSSRVVKDAFDVIVMAETITSVMELDTDLHEEDGTPLWTLAGGEVRAAAE